MPSKQAERNGSYAFLGGPNTQICHRCSRSDTHHLELDLHVALDDLAHAAADGLGGLAVEARAREAAQHLAERRRLLHGGQNAAQVCGRDGAVCQATSSLASLLENPRNSSCTIDWRCLRTSKQIGLCAD